YSPFWCWSSDRPAPQAPFVQPDLDGLQDCRCILGGLEAKVRILARDLQLLRVSPRLDIVILHRSVLHSEHQFCCAKRGEGRGEAHCNGIDQVLFHCVVRRGSATGTYRLKHKGATDI